MKSVAQGYKFENAHIRLGSKIHLKDFYYAEKLFVNSYYATRFAYSIFQYIKENLDNWLSKRTNKTEITLLGYGTYSELLLSNLKSFLVAFYKKAYEFNATIIEDVEGLRTDNKKLIEGTENVILIIPVGATLTTSIKIERKLLEINNKLEIIGTPITCVVVAPKEKRKIKDDFWRKIDLKEKVITLTDGTYEKYFVFLESDWFEPHTCPECFPREDNDKNFNCLKKEKPLFETNKVSVVPSAIFSLPISKHDAEQDCNNRTALAIKYLKEEHLIPMPHIVRGNNHFLYYIDTDRFHADNKQEIKEWLTGLRQKFDKTNSPVVLIAPEHNTNAEFANEVNEIIFGGTGTLIHQDPGDDYKINFNLFYSHIFQNNPLVIFVDDAICTGNSLNLLRELVRGAYQQYKEKIKVISMIDRASWWFNKTEDFETYSLLSINLPPNRSEKLCFLCAEAKKYDEIIEKHTCELELEIIFRAKKEKIKIKEFSDLSNQSYEGKSDKQSRYLKRIGFFNCLYILLKENIQKLDESKSVVNFVEHELVKHFTKRFDVGGEYIKKESIEDIFAQIPIDEKMNILKVIAYPYLSLFKNIRPIASKLVLNEFLLLIGNIRDDSSMENIKYFLILLKTVGKLNLNVVLRRLVITEVIKIIDSLPNGIRKKMNEISSAEDELIKEKESIIELAKSGIYQKELFESDTDQTSDIKQKLERLREEKRFLKEKAWDNYIRLLYGAEIKEIIHNDEAKSYRLECELATVGNSQLKDLLIFENTTIFVEALERIAKELSNNKELIDQLKNLLNRNNQIVNLLTNLDRILVNGTASQLNINSQYRFEYLRKIINAMDKDNYNPANNDNIELKVSEHPTYKTFLFVLILKLFLETHKDTSESIQDKMIFISQIITEITGADGCFITVKHYNFDNVEDVQDGIVIIGTTAESLTNKEIDKHWLTYNHWNDLLKDVPCTYKTATYNDNYAEFSVIKPPNEVKNICAIGIADVYDAKKQNESIQSKFKIKPYGLITLYSFTENAFPLQKLRMLMLLKQELLGFLKKNYENDSFAAWIGEHKKYEIMREITHDLKTPLTRLRENLTTIKGEQNSSLVNNLMQDIDDKLLLINLELNHKKKNNKIWLYSFLQGFIEKFDSIRFDININDGFYIFANRVSLSRVFDNIFQNAIEAKAKKINIKFDENQNLLIENTGESIPEKIKEKIFEKEMSTKDYGTGLGLHIVKKIMQLHKGDIKLIKCAPVTFLISFKKVEHEE